jgi:hypothetical protein
MKKYGTHRTKLSGSIHKLGSRGGARTHADVNVRANATPPPHTSDMQTSHMKSSHASRRKERVRRTTGYHQTVFGNEGGCSAA